MHEHVPWTPPQFGGGNRDVMHSDAQFDIIRRVDRRNQLGLRETGYSVRFKNVSTDANESLTTRMVYLKKTLQKIVSLFKAKMSEADTAQLILYSNPEAIKSVFSTPFMRKSDFTYAYISNRVVEVLNSNEDFRINKEMLIDVKVIYGSGGRGVSLKNSPNFLKLLFKKRSVLRNKGKDGRCFARALLYAINHHKRKSGTISEARRSEERRVGKECRSRWSPYH